MQEYFDDTSWEKLRAAVTRKLRITAVPTKLLALGSEQRQDLAKNIQAANGGHERAPVMRHACLVEDIGVSEGPSAQSALKENEIITSTHDEIIPIEDNED